jgi:hypothetical protein
LKNDFLQRLIAIRQQEMKIWEELLMLEMRVLCKFLPLNLNQLENFIVPMSYSPIIKEQKAIQFNNKQYKIIQEGKRNWLNIFLNAHEIKLQEYEQQYHSAFLQLEKYLLLNNTTTIAGSSILNKIKEYMTYQTNRLKQDTYNKMSSFRVKLLQNRQRSLTTKDTIGVSPEPYLDLHSNPFSTCQWAQLSLGERFVFLDLIILFLPIAGPSFIRLNQSALRPQHQQKIEIKKEHKDISQNVKEHLVPFPHCIPLESPYFKQYSYQLLNYLDYCYFSPILYKDQIQALQQIHIASTIRQKIKIDNLIIRITDKGHNFYIGSAIEFEKKAQKFFSDTNAFIQLSENPFNEIQDKVISLLNKLRQKEFISKKQYNEMIPDRIKSELAHLYFNPKTHKV